MQWSSLANNFDHFGRLFDCQDSVFCRQKRDSTGGASHRLILFLLTDADNAVCFAFNWHKTALFWRWIW